MSVLSPKSGSGFLSSEMFTRKQILGMLAPLILDQLFIYGIGLLTTSMISSSGQDSVSAVSLVSPLVQLTMALVTAFSAGGGVVIAQYKGHGDEALVKKSIGQTVWLCMVIAVVINLVLILFSRPLVELLFSAAEDSVKRKAAMYLAGMAFNNFVHALRVAATAGLRATGDVKTNMYGSILINASYFIFSFVFLNVLHMDIVGTLISYFLARTLGFLFSMVQLFLWKKSSIAITLKDAVKPAKEYLRSIVKLAIPFSTEDVFFNVGGLLVSSIVVLMGTAAVAANAIANSVFNTMYSPTMAVGILATTVVGQCIGAGRKDLARKYAKELVILGYIVCIITAAVMLPFLKPIISIYHPSEEAMKVISELILIGAVGMLILYPASIVTPNILKAAGDAYYSSWVALGSMWIVRVVFGYVTAIVLHMGMRGIWLMILTEWAVRIVFYGARLKGDKWLMKKAIEAK